MNGDNGFNGMQENRPNQENEFNNQIPKNNTIKIVSIVVGVVVVIGIAYTFLAGKTLTCTRQDKFYGISYEDTIKAKFRDDKVKRIEQIGTIDLGSNISRKDEFIDAIKEEYDETKSNGFSYSISSKDTKVTFKITASSMEAVENFYYLDEDDNYDSVKNDLISNKYTCK